MFRTVVSVDTVFVTVFPTTVEILLSCGVHVLLCTCEFPTTFISIVFAVVGHVLEWSKTL